MPLQQSIDSARAERIGVHGISDAALNEALMRSTAALDWIRARHADGALPLLRLPERRDDIAELMAYATMLRDGATDLVFLGTGGSSLGGQTLAQLSGYAVPGLGALRSPRLHFLDNLDPETFGVVLERLPLATARFVAISKSGGTGETLMQSAAVLAALKAARLDPQDHVIGITEAGVPGQRNGMRDLFSAHRIPLLDHDPGVGGRFSVLSNVGMLPAAICGLDLAGIRAGAAAALEAVLDKRAPADVPAAAGAALSVALGKPISVMLAYADRLERFTHWFVQLWAESLGKDGKGITPVAALGPVDQHSQLQLFIAGPRDKLFTVITTGAAGRGPRIEPDLARLAGEPDFAGKAIGDLVAAQGRATAETLAKNGCPVRTIHIERLDEASLGELLMHFMLETIIAAHLLGIDAFDQPAVEEGKLLAKKYLSGQS